MNRLAKPIRRRDPQYLAWIRSLPCMVTGKNSFPTDSPLSLVEAHHVREEGKGGIGTKPDDSRAVPLEHWLHRIYHDHGRERFERTYGVNFEAEIKRLNALYLRTHKVETIGKERKLKVRAYKKKPVRRAWAILQGDEICFPVVETMREAQLLSAGRQIKRVQIRIEGK